MTTTDKLTDAELFHYTHAGKPSERLMARELLAHRRASQAAPAPSDGLREAVDAAWNDAIEAAAGIPGTSPQRAHRIRALRRAAPTEDR